MRVQLAFEIFQFFLALGVEHVLTASVKLYPFVTEPERCGESDDEDEHHEVARKDTCGFGEIHPFCRVDVVSQWCPPSEMAFEPPDEIYESEGDEDENEVVAEEADETLGLVERTLDDPVVVHIEDSEEDESLGVHPRFYGTTGVGKTCDNLGQDEKDDYAE